MSNQMNTQENKIFNEEYPDCDEKRECDDFIFTYPAEELSINIEYVINKMQIAFTFLKYLTKLSPINKHKYRTFIGYKKEVNQPNCKKNRIFIPWSYINKDNEPLDVCSHEIVHPFYAKSPLHSKNEGWGEGFCDFLRGPVKMKMGLCGLAWSHKMVKAAQENDNGKYHNPAGQFILFFQKYHNLSEPYDTLLNETHKLKDFVQHLFKTFENVSLSKELSPTMKMVIKSGYDKL